MLNVAGERAAVDLGEDVMQGAAKAEGLVYGGVEAIEQAQLELVGAFEKVLEIGEGELDVDLRAARRGGSSPAARQ